MIELPNCDINTEEQINLLAEIHTHDIIKRISIFVLTEDLNTSFYNFSDFFLINRINNDELKNILKDKIIKMLLEKGYKLAYVFNKTGLVICRSEEEIESNVWRSNLDFSRL
tara:strand:+ start:1482 stop:1817 length:336 start_codon:yes stop_codon:yes gene_type:complete